jgi:hypothetical protein
VTKTAEAKAHAITRPDRRLADHLSAERKPSLSTIWDEHAVASVMGSDGFRVIVGEGRLDRVVDQIVEASLRTRDIRVSLPNRHCRPSSFADGDLAELVRRRRVALADRVRSS